MLQKDDKFRFETMIKGHTAYLRRFAYYLSGSSVEADDLVQQASLRAWEGFHTLREPAKARAWLFTILRREFIKRGKRTNFDRNLLPLEEVLDAPDPRTPVPGLLLDLEQAVLELPEIFRLPLLMQVVAGLSVNEITEALEIPRGTVLSRLSRARKHLLARHPEASWSVYSRQGKVS